MCACVRICVETRSLCQDIFICSPLSFLRQGLQLNLELMDSEKLTNQEVLVKPPVSTPHGKRVADIGNHAQLLCGC